MSKLITTALAATLAITIAIPAALTDADAGKKGRYFAGGLAAGIIGTAIIARESRRRDREYDRSERRWDRHVRRCYAAYRSYDERSDTWIDKYGRERICRK
ncbi:BA14K family protein [Pseudahrensia aquimaris]|uniref:Lectin-like protein BA14k n=1 Tax=Pseudahrensia aquimaris TaxID=744461 RepID=A0ABW3FJ66_9HYPH